MDFGDNIAIYFEINDKCIKRVSFKSCKCTINEIRAFINESLRKLEANYSIKNMIYFDNNKSKFVSLFGIDGQQFFDGVPMIKIDLEEVQENRLVFASLFRSTNPNIADFDADSKPLLTSTPKSSKTNEKSIVEIITHLISNSKYAKIPSESSKISYWRMKVVGLVGKHLMQASNNNPSSDDKEAYAKALVTAFPILKVTSGEYSYTHIYGFLQSFIINNGRQSNPQIQTRQFAKRKLEFNTN